MKLLTVAVSLLCLLALPAMADRNDPRLDALFAKLQSLDDSSQAPARAIEAHIWFIWFQHDDPQVRKLMDRGLRALANGRFQAALTDFNQVIEIDPDYAEGWNQRAVVYYFTERYKKCLADVKRVLKLVPRHFGAYQGRGLCLTELGRPLEAIEAYRSALEINPHLEQAQLEIIRLRAHMT